MSSGVEPHALPGGYILHVFDTTSSTMDEAHKLAQQGAPEGTLVLAHMQNKGRGRLGRVWVSGAGNLHLSLVLRPKLQLKNVASISFLLALAAGHALLPFLPREDLLAYKWPNDLIVGDKKIGGCLFETSGNTADTVGISSYIVAGLGINLKQAPSNQNMPTTALIDYGSSVSLQSFLALFCTELTEMLPLIESEGLKTLRHMWLARAWRLGESLTVRDAKGVLHEGMFEDILNDGSLLLRMKFGKLQKITTGEVM